MRWFILFCFAATVLAQDAPYRLRAGARLAVPGLASGMIISPTRCDEDGSIYYRGYSGRIVGSPPLKVTADGSEHFIFDFSRIDDEAAKGLQMYDYAVSGASVYLVGVNEKAQPIILRLDAHGQFEKLLKVDREIHPVHIAVFPAGHFLLFGSRAVGPPTEKQEFAPVAESLYQSSRFLTAVKFGTKEKEFNDSRKLSGADLTVVDLALVESGPDGVYYLPQTEHPVLHVISVGGEVERRLHLATPGEGYRPVNLRVGRTQVVVEYSAKGKTDGGPDTFYYAVYDARTGERQSGYETDGDIPGAFGCYDWNGGFTFLTGRDGKREILRAQAK